MVSNMPIHKERDRINLESPIKLSEIENATDGLPCSKTPCPEDINAVFFKRFKNIISKSLLEFHRHTYEVIVLTLSFTKAYTVLISKTSGVGKLQYVTGYPTIALRNVVFKFSDRVLNKCRLQSVFSRIAGNCHACGIKSCTIQTKTHVARSVLDCCANDEARVAMLQADLAKPFHRVWHDVLFYIMEQALLGSVTFKICVPQLFYKNHH